MTTLPAVNQQCAVCGAATQPTGGWRRVYHYALADGRRFCGQLIHDDCRYRTDSPPCPCGQGPAEEGLLAAEAGQLDPQSIHAPPPDLGRVYPADYDESIDYDNLPRDSYGRPAANSDFSWHSSESESDDEFASESDGDADADADIDPRFTGESDSESDGDGDGDGD
jgi:hypothetical protein